MDELPRYTADMFRAPEKECDIVMKGGVTSGVVYPYAILELARVYRFRSIGGTSAGAIAASFAAAAEYARTVRADPAGFTRLQERCDTIPEILSSLFQPAPRFRSLMRYLLRGQAQGGSAWFWGLFRAFPWLSLTGMGVGAVLMWLLGGGIAGTLLGAAVGFVVAIAARMFFLVLHDIPRAGFGLCTGKTVPPANEVKGLTDWLHESIQYIAFGGAGHEPLTFGDLAGAEPLQPVINLRMITTNLSMQRPHTLPTLGIPAAYVPEEWGQLFPDEVIDFLERNTTPFPRIPDARGFPEPTRLPVLVATRMSLSFPLLFTAIPAHARDLATYGIARSTGATSPDIPNAKMWFADGGISSNFPIHMFDALFPSRPTFALSLDELPRSADPDGERVFIPQRASQGVGIPIRPIEDTAHYAGSILGSAKDWQDQLLGTMPGQRERIARIFLTKEEGGLNLEMPPERSSKLMRYGLTVGQRFAAGALDFDEHRWRRSLVAYEQLEQTVIATDTVWSGGFGSWLASYAAHPRSYKASTPTDRKHILARFADFTGLASKFQPVIKSMQGKFPRPTGRLRIGPDF